MLKKRYRLKSRSLFRQTLDTRRVCINDLFVLYGLPNQSTKPETLPRFGFVVSKKVHKRAVRRNRIKRHLREAVRLELMTRNAEQLRAYSAIVIIARAAMLEAPYRLVAQRLTGCFEKKAATSPHARNKS